MRYHLILVIFIAISSCSQKGNRIEAPVRVAGIPENAFWVGGVDGGNWYLIEDIDSLRKNASIRIYNDQDGSLIVSKRFEMLCPDGVSKSIDSLENQIEFFDGDRISLLSNNGKESCFLY